MTNRIVNFTVVSNRPLTSKTFLMRLKGDTGAICNPGEFVNVEIEGKFLRRPISLCDYDEGSITLLYDVVGDGTRWMSARKEGDTVNILTGLGNGFQPASESHKPLLLGGGVGIAPMLKLAKTLIADGKKPMVVMGYNTAAEVAAYQLFADEGIPAYVATVDGSMGTKGFVTDAIRQHNLDGDYFYACGPMPMLKALCINLPLPGQLSLESRMGCGFGACMCCSLETKNGAKRICKDGPIFYKEELIWK